MSECFFCGRANASECDDMCPHRSAPKSAATEAEGSGAWRGDHRRGWVANSLRHEAWELRAIERRSRQRFAKDNETSAVWREPALAFAAICAEAASVFERHLAELETSDAPSGVTAPDAELGPDHD